MESRFGRLLSPICALGGVLQKAMLLQVHQDGGCHVLGGALCAVWMEVTQHDLSLLGGLVGIVNAGEAFYLPRPASAQVSDI